MELNRTITTKLTLQTAIIENDEHQCISDSDSINSETVKSIPHSSPPASHDNTTTASTKLPSPPAESPARSSISSDRSSLSHGSFALEDKAFPVPTVNPPEKPQSPEVVAMRSVKKEPIAVTIADPAITASVKEGGGGGISRRKLKVRPALSILRGARRDKMVKRAALGFRIFGFVFCLVSFSVMAADRNQGWALDSFERYREFRYCMSVNVIGFVYSGAQAFVLAYQTATGKNLVQHHLRYFFDFSIDQMVTYLLISASSSAATRIDDWQSNWGKDKFPDMASASVSVSFLAFASLAFSSLISGYVLCNSKSS